MSKQGELKASFPSRLSLRIADYKDAGKTAGMDTILQSLLKGGL